MTDRRVPRPILRAFNLLRRFSSLSLVLGGLPVEPAAETIFPNLIGAEDVIVEVGARMGDGTRVLAKLGKQVYAFEPSRGSFLLLKTFTRKNKNVKAYNLALGSQAERATLRKDRAFSGVASLKKISDVRYSSWESVGVVRLDSLTFKLSPTTLVLDCEGSEMEVLKGAEKLLPKLNTVLVETHTMENGSDTIDAVVSELRSSFPKLRLESAGTERWVIAQRNPN